MMVLEPTSERPAGNKDIRVLIAEDSAVQAELLTAVLEDAGGFRIVGRAPDGLKAVAMTAELMPDIVLMDFHMPWLDGIEATRRIMAESPVPVVIASASFRASDVALVFETVKSGALAVIGKPASPDHEDHDRSCADLVRTLRLMSGVAVIRHWPGKPQPKAPGRPEAVGTQSEIKVVAIGGSTGAANVLVEILGSLPKTLAAPVLVVQHLSRGFSAGFAAWLGHGSNLKIKVAESGEKAAAGTVYVAPDEAHLGIDYAGRIVISNAPPENGFRPSVDYLFRSVAGVYGNAALGVLLSGMGNDGAAGMLALRQAGGSTFAQSEKTCVIFGMPCEAIKMGAVQHVQSPAEIGASIAKSADDARRR